MVRKGLPRPPTGGMWGDGKCPYSKRGERLPPCERDFTGPPRFANCSRQLWRPRIAHVVAGMVRWMLEEQMYIAYRRHVVDSLGGHVDSRVFLAIGMGDVEEIHGKHTGHRTAWEALGRLVAALRPAALEVTRPNDEPRGDAVIRQLREPECFWQGREWNATSTRVSPLEMISRQGAFWLRLNRAWELVAAWERQQGFTFDLVSFTRPDVYVEGGMGPWCAYADTMRYTWHFPPSNWNPDFLWLLPRTMAHAVLTTWPRVLVPCERGLPCCNLRYPGRASSGCTSSNRAVQPPLPGCHLSEHEGAHVGPTWWLLFYWSHVHNFSLSRQLEGYGRMTANPNKPGRNCTVHLGCSPWQNAALQARQRARSNERRAQLQGRARASTASSPAQSTAA